MKRIMTILAILCSLCTFAQHQNWQILEPKTTLQAGFGNHIHLQASAFLSEKADFVNKKDKAPKTVSVPKGKLYTYALTNKRVNQTGMTSNSGCADSLYVDGNTVYIRNFINDGSDGSYAVGQITDGNITNGIITFENGLEYANGKHAYIGTVDESGHLVPNRNASSFTFTIENGIIRSVAPEETLGHFYLMGYTAAGGLVGYNIDYLYEPVPSDIQNIKIPNHVKMTAYEGISEPISVNDEGSKFITFIGFDNNDVYFKNIIPRLGEAVLKGSLEGSKIVFDVKKYIGKYENFYICFYAGQVDNEGGRVVLNPVNTDKLYMDYDKATGTIKSNHAMVFLAGQQTLGGYWNNPTFTVYTEQPVIVPSKAKALRYTLSTRTLPDDDSSRSAKEVWVLRDGNDFYFRNVYAPMPDLAFKGTLDADGKTISVSIPQYMGHGYQDQAIQLAAATHDIQETVPPSAIYSYLDLTENLKFSYDPESKKIGYGGNLCTVVYGTKQPIGGLDCPEWTVQNDTVAIIPESAIAQDYILSTDFLRDYSRMEDMHIPSYVTQIASDGDMYYLHGFNEDYVKINDNAILVGKRSGNRITFKMPQLISTQNNDLIYAYVADYDSASKTIDITDANMLEFTVDDTNNTLTCDRSIAVKTAAGKMQFYYVKPTFSLYAPKPAKPKSGIPENHFDEINTGQGMRYIHIAEFFYEDIDGNYLSPDSLTYSIYMDGELYTFRNSFYFEEFSEDVTEVPMTTVSARFNHYLMERRLFTPDNAEKTFGVQVHYYCGNSKTSSDITTINKKTGEITVTEVKEAVPVLADPIPSGWRERGQRKYNFMFSIPEEDADGNAIDPSKLFYRIFMDDSPYTFSRNNYSDFDDDTTEVPVILNSSDFNKSGTDYMIMMREAPQTKIGVQTIYRSGANEARSKIGYYNIETGEVSYVEDISGVDEIETSDQTIVKKEYYLPTGIKVTQPLHGMYILRLVYSDGTSQSKKVMIR